MITLSILLLILLIGAIVALIFGAGIVFVIADIAVAIGLFVVIIKLILK